MYTLLLAALMTVFSLAACGSNEGNSVSGSGSANSGGAGTGSTAADGSGSGSGSANDDGMGGMTGSGSSGPADSGLNGGQGGSSIAGSSNGSSSAAGSNGSSASGSGDALTRGARDVVRGTENAVSDATGGLLRGASYEQMLRNARVHDTDGDLYDYENAMTPGTRYF